MKYNNVDFGTTEAIFNKLGGLEGMERFLRGETFICSQDPSWGTHNNTVYFDLTSNGLTGPQWVERLEKGRYFVHWWVKEILLSDKFIPTNRVTSKVAVMSGSLLEDEYRTTDAVWVEANKKNFKMPRIEIACLMLEKFKPEEFQQMGFNNVIVMHQPFWCKNQSEPCLLSLGNRNTLKQPRLDAYLDLSNDPPVYKHQISKGTGFAFIETETEM